MIVGIGTDIIEIERIKRAVEKTNHFVDKLFTKREIEYFNVRNNAANVIAGNFAAKEAVSKAIGTGFRSFGLKDIEILRDKLGKPFVILNERVYEIIGTKNVIIHISISHSNENDIAYAVMEERQC